MERKGAAESGTKSQIPKFLPSEARSLTVPKKFQIPEYPDFKKVASAGVFLEF
jgi:hypothetical protein